MKNSKDIADLVIGDIKKRKAFGRKKYGVPLRANNGRNALQDAYEESQDMTLYLKQKLVEEEQSEHIDVEKVLALEVTKAVLAEYQKKSKNTLLVSFKTWLDKEIKKHGIS
jgi:hypothetical protein